MVPLFMTQLLSKRREEAKKRRQLKNDSINIKTFDTRVKRLHNRKLVWSPVISHYIKNFFISFVLSFIAHIGSVALYRMRYGFAADEPNPKNGYLLALMTVYFRGLVKLSFYGKFLLAFMMNFYMIHLMSYEFTKMSCKLARKTKFRGPRLQTDSESLLQQRLGAKVLRVDVIDENDEENVFKTAVEESKKTN